MPYNPDCLTDSRVYVNGTRLPVGDVDVYMRKEGPMEVTRYCEFTFASPLDGEDYTDVFNGFEEDTQSDWDTVRVEILDDETREYITEFHGMITGVGNSPGPEIEWQARVQGPGMFVDKITASKVFETATPQNVLEYCTFAIAEKLPLVMLVNDSSIEDPDTVKPKSVTNTAIKYVASATGAGAVLDNIIKSVDATQKTFKSNKHTIADVLDWLQDKTQTRIWFEPYENGAALVISDEPTSREHKAHYLGGGVNVVDNDALVELNPVNTIIVNGKAGSSLFADTPFEVKEVKEDIADNEYQTVKARHETLYERAGKTEYVASPDQPVDGRSKQSVINEAKSLLKTQIDETTGGDMKTLLASPIRPFDTLTAKPTCSSSPASDTDTVTYEVSRVHHEVKAGEFSTTKLNIGVHTALDDINVANVETNTE